MLASARCFRQAHCDDHATGAGPDVEPGAAPGSSMMASTGGRVRCFGHLGCTCWAHYLLLVLLGVVHRSGFSDNGDLDLPGILQALLDFLGDFPREVDDAQIVYILWSDDDADLAPRYSASTRIATC